MTAEEYIERQEYWWLKDWAELLLVLILGFASLYMLYKIHLTNEMHWYKDQMSKGQTTIVFLVVSFFSFRGLFSMISGNRIIEIEFESDVVRKKRMLNEVLNEHEIAGDYLDGNFVQTSFTKWGLNHEVKVVLFDDRFLIGAEVPKDQFLHQMSFDWFGHARRMKVELAEGIRNKL